MRRAVALILVSMGALAPGCGGDKGEAQPALGEHTAAALLTGVAKASAVLAPWPCAALDDVPEAPPRALRLQGWKLDGLALVPSGEAAAVAAVGFVADGGGDAPETVVQLRRAAEAFGAGRAALVVSLGGMGNDAESIAAALRALAGAGVPVVAMPGDLEPLAEHRRAVERLQQEDLPVVDGSVVRWMKLGPATIATLPGARHEAQLMAAKEGCAFDDAAIDATLSRLTKADGLMVLASWAAPRAGAVTSASGDLPLRQALDRAHVAVAVAGEPTQGDERAERGDRAGRPGGATQVVLTGFADGEPRMPAGGKVRRASAVLMKLTRSEWRVQPVDLAPAAK
jgi:hypothetical protein